MAHAIAELPPVRLRGETAPRPDRPACRTAIPVQATIEVDPEAGHDRGRPARQRRRAAGRDQPVEACSTNNAVAGILNVLDHGCRINAGSFRRLRIRLREGCVVGIPAPPRLLLDGDDQRRRPAHQRDPARLRRDRRRPRARRGRASRWAGYAVDLRRATAPGGAPYINQLIVGTNGGPGDAAGRRLAHLRRCPLRRRLIYRDSVEVDEHKYPDALPELRLLADSGGAGRFRGAPASVVEFGPTEAPMWSPTIADGHATPAAGARGGLPAHRRRLHGSTLEGDGRADPERDPDRAPTRRAGRGVHGGGGGYGDPRERDPARVLADVLEGWVSAEQARDVYRVALSGSDTDESLAVDEVGTAALRRGVGANETRGGREA